MAEGIVRCIVIVHPLDEIRLYRILSAFFRFVGIFVCENISGQEYGGKTDWRYEVEPGSEESGEPLEQRIYTVLQDMKGLFGTAALEALETEYGENHAGIIYIWAAKSTCRRRENEIHAIIWNAIQGGLYGNNDKEKECLRQELWKWHFYSFEEISGDIVKILKKSPEFYGAHTIRGFSMEVDDDYRIDSFVELKRAVQKIGKESYASYVYYRMGRYCEKIRQNLPEKIDYYKKAYEVNFNNYRAVHKLAVDAYERHQYKEAAKLYSNKKNEDPEKGFYPWMFGSEPVIYEGQKKARWQVYKSAAKKKLKIQDIYLDIMNVTIRRGWYEEYSDYSFKLGNEIWDEAVVRI